MKVCIISCDSQEDAWAAWSRVVDAFPAVADQGRVQIERQPMDRWGVFTSEPDPDVRFRMMEHALPRADWQKCVDARKLDAEIDKDAARKFAAYQASKAGVTRGRYGKAKTVAEMVP